MITKTVFRVYLESPDSENFEEASDYEQFVGLGACKRADIREEKSLNKTNKTKDRSQKKRAEISL